ncbi:nuclear transport factor 2 family protein [Gordonia sp. p3-SID1431]|uniref:nuclear transport factor 2 family protein n=1 Tax=Gordonia sp. p3-SID1431 TaxID=2916159 RepID=UPI0037BEF9D6
MTLRRARKAEAAYDTGSAAGEGGADSAARIVAAIKRLEYRYWRASDAKDVTAFRDCFVRAGAQIDYGPVGTFGGTAG